MKPHEQSAFGAMLRRERLRGGWTQEELAERSNISVEAVGSLERGTRRVPRLTTLRRLAEALQLSEDERAAFVAAARVDASHSSAPSLLPDEQLFPSYPLPADGAFVGRDEELDRTLRLVATRHDPAPIDGNPSTGPRLVLLGAEAGMGKTRLLAEVAKRSRERGVLTLAGGCYEQEGRLPYGPIRDALLDYIRIQSPASLHAQLDDLLPDLGRILPEIGSQDGTLPQAHGYDTELERTRLFSAVAQALERISRNRALVLFIDDLQWADHATLQILHFLLRYPELNRGLVIGAYRKEDLHADAQITRFVQEVERAGRAQILALEPLSQDDLGALLTGRLGAACPPALVEELHSRSGGNPFFALQMLELLKAEGNVATLQHTAPVRGDLRLELPPAVRETILRRLDGLTPDERETLMLGAVLGREFDYRALEAMWPGDERSLFEAVDRAVAVRLLQETETGYAFDHPLLWEVVYQRVPTSRRPLLHERAGNTLESLYADRLEAHVAELAYHFTAAGQPHGRRAMRYLLLVGDQAESVFAHADAERGYGAALQLGREIGDQRREAEAGEKLGAVRAFVGQYDEALELLEMAARTYHDLGDPDAEGRVVARIGCVYLSRGMLREGLCRVQPLADALRPLGPSRGLAAVTLALSDLHHRKGDYVAQLALAQQALKVAQEVGDEAIQAQAQDIANSALSFLGRRQPATLPDPDPADFPDGADDFAYLDRLAERTMLRGEFTRSKEYRIRALSVARKRSDIAEVAFQQLLLGRTAFLMGTWQEARDHLEETLLLGRTLGAVQSNIGPRMDLGDLSFHEGDWKEAARWLHEGLDLAISADDLYAIRVIQLRLARLDILEGRPEAAVERLTPLLDRPGFEETLVTPMLAFLAWARLEMGDLDRAEEMIESALRRARREHRQEHLVETLGVRARIFMVQRCWERAEEALYERLALASGMPYPYARATSLYELGLLSCAIGDPDAARKQLLQAIDIFRQLGAKKDIERTEETLARLDRA